MARRVNLKRPVLFLNIARPTLRRAVLQAIVRTAGIVVLSLLLYFFVPIGGFDDANSIAAWLRLAAVVLVFLAAMTFQVRLVAGAKAPLIRASEAIVQSVLLFLCLFAILYASMSTTDPASFSEPLSRVDSLYFTSMTLTTVGFGDIAPESDLARALVTVQMLAGLVVLVLVAKVFLFAAMPTKARSARRVPPRQSMPRRPAGSVRRVPTSRFPHKARTPRRR